MGQNFILPGLLGRSNSLQVNVISDQTSVTRVNVQFIFSYETIHDYFDVQAGSSFNYDLSKNMFQSADNSTADTILLDANNYVRVFVSRMSSYNLNSYFALYPIGSLTSEYLVVTSEPHPSFFSQIVIVSTVSGSHSTAITVSVPSTNSTQVEYNNKQYGAGEQIDIKLDGQQVIYLKSAVDPTGLRIESSEHVAVFTTEINFFRSSYRNSFNQIPPSNSLGKDFIVLPMSNSDSSTEIKLVAKQKSTTVTIDRRNYTLSHAGEFILKNINKNTFIKSDRPIVALQITKQYAVNQQVILSPTWQYQKGYAFINPYISSGEFRLEIAVPKNYINNIILDGHKLEGIDYLVYGSGYNSLGVELDEQVEHYIYSDSTDEESVFFIMVYGDDNNSPFMYSPGYCLRDLTKVNNLVFIGYYIII